MQSDPMPNPPERPPRGLGPGPLRGNEMPPGVLKEGTVIQGGDKVVTIEDLTFLAAAAGAMLIGQNKAAPYTRRPQAIDLRQHPPVLLDRERERQASFSPEPTLIEIFGADGFGKTTLLGHLAHDLPKRQPSRYQDGIAYLQIQGLTFDDLLFEVWSAFYQTPYDWRVRPSSVEQRLSLRDIDALILLDDAGLSENECRSLDAALPESTVMLATEEQRIFGFGKSILIAGLPREHVRGLAEIQLRRLAYEGVAVPDQILDDCWSKYQGNPFRIAREISRWAQSAGKELPPLPDAAVASVVAECVQALEAPVPSDVLAGVTGEPSAGAVAAELAAMSVLKAHSPRYTYPWPETVLPPEVAADYKIRALLYIGQISGIRDRADLHPLALHLLEWIGGTPELYDAVDTDLPAAATTIARALSDAYMAAAHLDRWAAALHAALPITEYTRDLDTQAWARHNLGAAALCRGDLQEARSHLEMALGVRYGLADPEATEATLELLNQVETRISREPGDASSETGAAPVPYDHGPGSGGEGAAARERELAGMGV